MKNKKYYFAYGSNMNLEQMKHRCPNSTVKDNFELEGLELEFKSQGFGSFATVKQNENCKTPVVMWEITEKDELNLDRYEGCPNFYRKEYITVEFDDEIHDVLIYVMNDQSYGIPSKGYIDVIEEGYKSAGFDTDILYDYLKKSNMKIEGLSLFEKLGDNGINGNYSRENVKFIKEYFNEGDEIELLSDMVGEKNMPKGLKGTVRTVDDNATIHMSWENGRGLGLTGVDKFKKIELEQTFDEEMIIDEEMGMF